ncbi:transporter substrate-binding domain-containing protein [uncultured Tolumonas sp.]|uniref:substrate-binding periplasmic protein n=1 Tax=uncultured Tolumonas sp. TaxID=263765 RepID=UPI00292EAB15|nr:transporter substrate-binding domain-containing protein [uncultured Tolumonas sp.]
MSRHSWGSLLGRVAAALAAALLCAEALAGQPLTIYTEVSPPFQSLDAQGQPAGFACEVVKELQRRTGSQDPIQVVPWVRGYLAVQNEPYVALFSMARTKERLPLFRWVGPLADLHYAFFVTVDSRIVIRSMEDARRLRLIGVYKEDARDQYLTAQGFRNLDRSVDALIPLRKLLAGRVDAIVSTRRGLAELCRSLGTAPTALKEAYPFLQSQLYIAFSKGTPEPVVRKWSTALESMKKDGSFERLFHRYFPGEPLPAESKPTAPRTPPFTGPP